MTGHSCHAIVIGASVGGLAAAAYLARRGLRVVVLEAGERTGGAAQTFALEHGARASLFAPMLHALDWDMVQTLDLMRYGLRLVRRDAITVGLRSNGRHLVLSRARCANGNGAEALSRQDIGAYSRFKHASFGFARKLQRLWLEGRGDARPPNADAVAAAARICALSDKDTAYLRMLAHRSAAAWLDCRFESDALKAVIGFDAISEPLSPDEPGSALMLLWRSAQGFARQGDTVQPLGGAGNLTAALELAARTRGAEIRLNSRVTRIGAENGRASGVALEGGELVHAPIVLSSLDARRTLLELAPLDAIGFGTAARLGIPVSIARAQIVFVLSAPPPFVGLEEAGLVARLVAAARPESAAQAKAAALAGLVPDDPVLEIAIPTAADPSLAPPGQHVVIVSVPFVSVAPVKGWETERDVLLRRVAAALESFAPGFKDRVLSGHAIAPPDIAPLSLPSATAPIERLLNPYAARITTPIAGVYLCGGDAEPAPGLSGRAGRVAANLALSRFAEDRAA